MPGEPNYEGTIRYISCPSCGSGNPAAASTCSRCGKPLAAATPPVSRPSAAQASQMECPKCHKAFPAGSKFCGYCGVPLAAASPAVLPDSLTWPLAAKPVPQSIPPKAAAQAPAPGASGMIPAAPASSWANPQPPPPRIPTFESAPPVASSQMQASAPPSARPAPPSPQFSAGSVDITPRAGLPEGTVVFDGFGAASIEAQISEKKHDGTWGNPLPIVGGLSIGRANCEINFPDDPRLADRHALISNREGKLFLEDFGSASGTFIKQRQDTELIPGDVFLLGQDLFRFTTQNLDETPNPGSLQGTMAWTAPPKLHPGPVTAKLEHIMVTGEVIEEFQLENPETTLGRTKAHLVFKDDHYMSATHARIVAQPGRFILQDLRSRNGVYRQVRNEIELEAGDEFFLGEHIFRVEIKPLI